MTFKRIRPTNSLGAPMVKCAIAEISYRKLHSQLFRRAPQILRPMQAVNPFATIWWMNAGKLSAREVASLQKFGDDKRKSHPNWRAHCVGRALAIGLVRHLAPELIRTPIRFVTGRHGRPGFAGGLSAAFDLNISHAGDVVACGISRSGRIGIDVEPLREVAMANQIAARHFTTRERALLADAGECISTQFLKIWSLKEAYLKAVGVGLYRELSGIQVDHKRSRILDATHSKSYKFFQAKISENDIISMMVLKG